MSVTPSSKLYVQQQKADEMLSDLKKAQKALSHLASIETEDTHKADTLLKLGKLYLYDMCLRSRIRIVVPAPSAETHTEAEITIVRQSEEDESKLAESIELFDDIYDDDDDTNPVGNYIPEDPNKEPESLPELEHRSSEASEELREKQGPEDSLIGECESLGQKSCEVFEEGRNLQNHSWVFPYMLGRAFLKLKKDRAETLQHLNEAVENLEKATGRSRKLRDRQVFEPFYRLHSTRLKFLRNDLEKSSQDFSIPEETVWILTFLSNLSVCAIRAIQLYHQN